MNPYFLISALTGSVMILASLFLLYKQRITLTQIAGNPNVSAEALKIEFDKWKISTNVPALGLFIIGVVLIGTPCFLSRAREYLVEGTVRKADGASARDVNIWAQYPPYVPPADGRITNLKVLRDPAGKLPSLTLVTDGYESKVVNLNEKTEAELAGDVVRLMQPVELRKMPKPQP